MKFKKTLIGSGIVLAAITGLALESMVSAGVFRTIEPHFDGQCTRVDGVVGAEDITVDPETGMAYISAMDRRTLISTGEHKGGIYIYRPGSFAKPIKFETDLSQPFHPHGIDLWKASDTDGSNALDRIFVVTHPIAPGAAGEAPIAISQIDIFEIDGDKLVHVRAVNSVEPISLNDVAAAGPDSFYASIDKGSVTPLGQTLELYARLARAGVMYGRGELMSRVADDMVYANGVQVSNDGKTLYVAETTGKRLSSFNISPIDGRLSPAAEIDINSGLDNIEIDADGDLWVVGHPKTFDFLAHAGDAANRSPSQVFKVRWENGALTADEIYLNDGDPISGASVAARASSPLGERLLIGSVFEPFILDCSL